MTSVYRKLTKGRPARRKDGSYVWCAEYDDLRTGRRVSKSTFKTKHEAQAYLAKTTVDVREGRHVADRDSITVAEAIDHWIETVGTVGRHGREPVGNATLRKYRERAENHLKPVCGDMVLAKITPADAARIRNKLLARCARPSAKKCLTDLKGALAEARLVGHMATDPFQDIRIVDTRAQGGEHEIPSAPELASIVAALSEVPEPYATMLFVLRWSGLRPEEARALPWTSVGDGSLKVSQAADESGEIVPTKTRAGFRTVTIPAWVNEALASWRRSCPIVPGGLVFPTKTGRPHSHANITNRGWYPALRRAGAVDRAGKPAFDLYSLRHYRISERLSSGENVVRVSREAGHANPGITFRVYAHAIEEGERAVNEDSGAFYRHSPENQG